MTPYRLIATDLDGTLLRPDSSVSERSRRAIRQAQDAGLTVVFVTARPPRDIRELAGHAGLDGLSVCANGAMVYDIGADRVLHHQRLDAALALDLIYAVRALDAEISFATEHGHKIGYEPAFPRFFDDFAHDHEPRVDHVHLLCEEETTKILVHHPAHEAEHLAGLVRPLVAGRAEVISSGGPFIELGASGVSKASGLKWLCAHLGIGAEQVIAFGDMTNDLQMLRFAGHAVAVANAHPQVLEAADQVTASNEDDGVARVIEALLAG